MRSEADFTVSHKGRHITFVIPPQIEREVRRDGVTVEGWLSNSHLWFDLILAELVDAHCGSDSKEEYGSYFTIVIYGFVDQFVNEHPDGVEVPTECDGEEVLGMGQVKVSRKSFKFKILKKQDSK